MISINDLTVSFGGFTLLDNINLHISDRDRIGLVGKNGAGKTTLLRLITGLQSPTSGRVVGPTPPSTRRESSSSMRTALVVMPRTCSSAPSSSHTRTP